jgi:hypothetical protein
LVNHVVVVWDSFLADGLEIGGNRIIGLDASAQTYGHTIYVKSPKGDLSDAERLGTEIHELTHVQQYDRLGHSLSNFGFEYAKGWAQAGFVYYDPESNTGIPLEVEAYDRQFSLLPHVVDAFSAPPPEFCLVGVRAQLSFSNTTQGDINYQFRWSSGDGWHNYVVTPGQVVTHFFSDGCGNDTHTPQIRFDHSFDPGIQLQQYRLDYNEVPLGGHNPIRYQFRTSVGGIDLFNVL